MGQYLNYCFLEQNPILYKEKDCTQKAKFCKEILDGGGKISGVGLRDGP